MSTFTNIPNSGSPEWKEAVANATLLPLYNNNIGDKRETLDTMALYTWNGVAWIAIASPAAAIAIDGLIGDVLATGPGVVQATLANVNMTTGSFGDASHTPTVTVNSKGLVTSSSQQSIQISESQVTNLVNDLAGKQPNLGFTPENVANKATNLTSPDNIKYPTTQAVSTGLSLKQDTITGAATTIVSSNLTANRALLSDNNGKVATNSVTSTELGYLSGVTSGIQSQINGKFNNPTGTITDYIAGNGTILPFPSTGGGGGGGVNYYLNGGTVQSVIGGTNYYQMSSTPVVGSNTDFNLTNASPIVSFITPPNFPGITKIPAGNWNLQIWASMSSNGGSPTMTAKVYKYDGSTFTLIATSIPEVVNTGTAIDSHFFSVAIPQTTLLATDQIAFTITAGNLSGLTMTIHTQDSHLCEIFTNIPSGIASINSLTIADQFLTVGTSGTNFNIASSNATHTFNLPTASATNRGALSSTDWTSFNNKLTKGTNTIFCIDNGDYATLQAAIDAAPSYPASCTILVGAKSGGWGDIVLPANKNLSITGLSAPKSEQVVFVNSVTYSPTTGTNPVTNNIHLCNLFISPQTAIQAVTFGGTAPARLRFTSCYIYGAAATSVILSNTNAVYSASSFTDCYFDMGNTSNTHISSSLRYAVFDRCNFNSGNKAFNVTGGFVQIGLSALQVNSTNEIITISNANTLVAMANSLIQNSTTNGSGVLIGTSAYFQSINNIITVATGTGYCVRGTGIHLYGQTTTGNSAISTNNVKMQNTLTNLPYTIGLTASP